MGRSIPARGLVLSVLLAAPGLLLVAPSREAQAVPLYPALDPAWLPHLPVCPPTDRTCDLVARRRIPACTWRVRPTPEGPRRVRICA
ncbi:hypothetical protein DA075_06175 [Methylobacterium currus]|uniref:Uncharacterized protein n=1 Tax=Methylobacterium currus TaxID=2051553 RepID=A0A2R4WGA5_9HYPH|nr:hypothetical protein [Methylobacterium currus]AWB20568.1 hypothetical protein DA075_06175 [Methylobacterium currus]UHC14672.1 hypothetical protein LRS73_19280 [Methylobacterium currus]